MFLMTTAAQAISGFFVWTALLITCHQVPRCDGGTSLVSQVVSSSTKDASGRPGKERKPCFLGFSPAPQLRCKQVVALDSPPVQ